MSAYTAEMAHAAARRGAAWLDKRCPNWINEIDLRKLDLGAASVCVLGQTAKCLVPDEADDGPDYNDVVTAYAPVQGDAWATKFGFNVPSFTEQALEPAFEMLTIAWRELIRERLEQPQESPS